MSESNQSHQSEGHDSSGKEEKSSIDFRAVDFNESLVPPVPPPPLQLQAGNDMGVLQKQTGSSQGVIQRSSLSDELIGLWGTGNNKAAFFDRLRSLTAEEREVDDLDSVVTALENNGAETGDSWLAETIIEHGPETHWPGSAVARRAELAQEQNWSPQSGSENGHARGITANQVLERGSDNYSVVTHFFAGTSSERAIIFAGIHGSELSAVEVADRLVADLQSGAYPVPYYNVIIVPRLFPENVAAAEASGDPGTDTHGAGRYSSADRYADGDTPRDRMPVEPNRQNPSPGSGISMTDAYPTISVGSGDNAQTEVMEPENVIRHRLIQRFRPSRVCYLHASQMLTAGERRQGHARNAGIYYDPRTDAEGNALPGYEDDAALALGMARTAQSHGASVGGNQIDDDDTANDRALYRGDTQADPDSAQPRSEGRDTGSIRGVGVSNGTHTATAIEDAAHPEANRAALTTITVEVDTNQRSQDFPAGSSGRSEREEELQAHAIALREVFLGPPAGDAADGE